MKDIFRVLLVERSQTTKQALVRMFRDGLSGTYELDIVWSQELHSGLSSLVSTPPKIRPHLIIVSGTHPQPCKNCRTDHTILDIVNLVAKAEMEIPLIIRAPGTVTMDGVAEGHFTLISQGRDDLLTGLIERYARAYFQTEDSTGSRPICPNCSEHMVRNGTMWKCLSDGYATAVAEATPVAHA